MAKKVHILRGIGSVVNISPSTNYNRFVPKQTSNERMAQSWEKTGQRIKAAIGRFNDGQKEA
jgi:hypothetical protein